MLHKKAYFSKYDQNTRSNGKTIAVPNSLITVARTKEMRFCYKSSSSKDQERIHARCKG